MSLRQAVIIGCGGIGCLAADRLVQAGVMTIGVRRQMATFPVGVHAQLGDARDLELYRTIERRFGIPDAVALTANPGLRGGGSGNGVEQIAAAVHRSWPHARLVYTSSTAVYADSGGRWIDEDGALATSDRARNLLTIEQAVARQDEHVILRAGALAGLDRARRSPRLASGHMCIRGPAWRSLSWIHEQDLADLVVRAIRGDLGHGIYNAVADEHPSVASFHRRSACELGWRLQIEGGPESAPERRVRAARLAVEGRSLTWRSWWS